MPYFITILFYLTLHTAVLAAPIKNFMAQYDLYYNDMYIGKTTRHLIKKDNLLTFSSVAKTDGIAAWFKVITITETSELRYKNNQLSFISYNYDEKKNDEIKAYKLLIDKNNKIYNSHTKKHYPVANNLHDMLGFTAAIMQDMKNGTKELKYTIAEKNKLKIYTLKFISKENITTNSGDIATHKMEHYNPLTKERFTLWCAENMGFLPIRISSYNHKGNASLLNLTKFNNIKFNLELDEEELD